MLNIKKSIGDNIINHIILNIFLIYITPYLRILNSSLEELKSTWKLLGSSSGTTALTLPDNFNELIVEAKCNSITQLQYSYHFIKNQLTNSDKSYHNGFYTGSGDFSSCAVNVSLSSVALTRMSYKGTEYKENSTITVYCK